MGQIRDRVQADLQLPEKFGGLDDGLSFCREFFPWYNESHHHSALAYLTPHQVHYGQAEEALRQRHEVLMTAFQAHPERFVGGPPRMPTLPRAVYINPPASVSSASGDSLPPPSKPLVLTSGSATPETEPLIVPPTQHIAAGGAASSSPATIDSIHTPNPSCPVLPTPALLNPSTAARPVRDPPSTRGPAVAHAEGEGMRIHPLTFRSARQPILREEGLSQ